MDDPDYIRLLQLIFKFSHYILLLGFFLFVLGHGVDFLRAVMSGWTPL